MAKKSFKLGVDKRTLTGRKVKQLRRDGIIPCNIFGKDVDSVNAQVDAKEFRQTFQEAGETNIITINLKGDKDTRPVLISAMDQDPVTNETLHISFHQVDLTQTVTATVPIVTTGESPAIKEQGGVMVLTVNEVDVEALPADLPDQFEVDISKLTEIGQSIQLSDLNLDTKKLTLELDLDTVIVSVQAQQEEEAEPEEEEPVEGEEAEAAKGEAEDKTDDSKEDSSEEDKKEADKKE